MGPGVAFIEFLNEQAASAAANAITNGGASCSAPPVFHTSLSFHSKLIVLDWTIQRLVVFFSARGKKSARCHIRFVFFQELGLMSVG